MLGKLPRYAWSVVRMAGYSLRSIKVNNLGAWHIILTGSSCCQASTMLCIVRWNVNCSLVWGSSASHFMPVSISPVLLLLLIIPSRWSQPARRRFLSVSWVDPSHSISWLTPFSGRYKDKNDEGDPNSRFHSSQPVSNVVRKLYFTDHKFSALDIITNASAQADLTMGETALRWLNWHSLLEPEHGDAIIIGASSVKHVEENMINLEKGVLPESVVGAVEEAWKMVGGDNFTYWHWFTTHHLQAELEWDRGYSNVSSTKE